VSAFEERLRRAILEHGPISVARFMALALAHPEGGYYARRDPLGAAGDFVTAPEVSQLFGELVGLALAQHWLDLGRPSRVLLVELGPGRGTLMADALRAARVVPGFPEAVGVHLVETSPVLRERQAAVLGGLPVRWHDELTGVPQDRPLLLVANEFLDALPIRQFVRRSGRWHERLVAVDDAGAFRFTLAPRPTPFPLVVAGVPEDPPDGAVLELGPAREALAEAIAARLVAQGGLALLIDYGSSDASAALLGDTLQGVRRHARVDPLAAPGEVDLSAHVDFGAIGRRAAGMGAVVYGPVGQAAFLGRLGIGLRLRQLLERAAPTQRDALESGCARLVAPDQMGELFKAMALTAPGAHLPPGFDPKKGRP
jgi:NADH dehydrogenase [ubiquinone] 1 alpha subcomplex assembly factor 7